MPAPRRYARKVHAPIPAPKTALAPPPVERPRVAWRREDGRGDIPADLWALMQEGGRRLTDAPSVHRAAQLLALTEHAAFKTWVPGTPAPWHGEPETPLEPPAAVAGGVSADWWDDIPTESEKPPATPVSRPEAMLAFAAEAAGALANLHDDPANEGEAAFKQPKAKEWWE